MKYPGFHVSPTIFPASRRPPSSGSELATTGIDWQLIVCWHTRGSLVDSFFVISMEAEIQHRSSRSELEKLYAEVPDSEGVATRQGCRRWRVPKDDTSP